MSRVDFLFGLLLASVCWEGHERTGEEIYFYLLMGISVFALTIAWVSQIRYDLLAKSCNLAGKDFTEKYKDLP